MKYGSIESLNCHLPYNDCIEKGNDNSNNLKYVTLGEYIILKFCSSFPFILKGRASMFNCLYSGGFRGGVVGMGREHPTPPCVRNFFFIFALKLRKRNKK